MWEIVSNFVAFLEKRNYTNFKLWIILLPCRTFLLSSQIHNHKRVSNQNSCCSLLPSCQSSLVKSCHCRLDFSIQVLFSFSFLDFYQVDLLSQFSMPPLISQILKRRTVNWKFSTVLLFENQYENKHNIWNTSKKICLKLNKKTARMQHCKDLWVRSLFFTFSLVYPSYLWKYHFLIAIFFAVLKNEKIGSLAVLWPALALFRVLLQICSIDYKILLQATRFST
jgi:hypothetical protein